MALRFGNILRFRSEEVQASYGLDEVTIHNLEMELIECFKQNIGIDNPNVSSINLIADIAETVRCCALWMEDNGYFADIPNFKGKPYDDYDRKLLSYSAAVVTYSLNKLINILFTHLVRNVQSVELFDSYQKMIQIVIKYADNLGINLVEQTLDLEA